MAMVLIKCPVTNLPVSTGLFMEENDFESATLGEEDRRMSCHLCQEVHVWQKDQAYLVEEEEPILGA